LLDSDFDLSRGVLDSIGIVSASDADSNGGVALTYDAGASDTGTAHTYTERSCADTSGTFPWRVFAAP